MVIFRRHSAPKLLSLSFSQRLFYTILYRCYNLHHTVSLDRFLG